LAYVKAPAYAIGMNSVCPLVFWNFCCKLVVHIFWQKIYTTL